MFAILKFVFNLILAAIVLYIMYVALVVGIVYMHIPA